MISSKQRINRAAGTVSFFTLLSRILGLIRDIVIAKIFGSGIVTDAFFVALRIPNLLRRLFGEGSLTVAFIPVFLEYLNRDKKDALKLANGFLTLTACLLAIIAILGVLFAPLIVRIQAYGFDTSSYAYSLTVLLTRITFPYVFFICLVAFFMGVLNSFKHFTAPAAAPVLLNLSIIAAAFFLSPHLSIPIAGLAIGVIIGGGLQLLLQLPWAIKYGIDIIPNFSSINHPGIKRIAVLMLPAIFGSAVYQLNQFVGTFLASFLPPGSISWLYYADRLIQFPLGVFAVSMSTAALPSLSDHVAEKRKEDFKETLRYALSLTFFISIPSMAGLIVLGKPIIAILFQRGAFHHIDTLNTSYALIFYATGLWAFSGIRILVSAFYAMQDTKTPVKIATIALILNLVFSIILMHPLKHGGLALSLSITSSIQFFMLFVLLRHKIGSEIVLLKDVLKFCICAFIMAAILYCLNPFFFPANIEAKVWDKILRLFLLIALGVFIYLFTAKLLDVKEVKSFSEMFVKKIKQNT